MFINEKFVLILYLFLSLFFNRKEERGVSSQARRENGRNIDVTQKFRNSLRLDGLNLFRLSKQELHF